MGGSHEVTSGSQHRARHWNDSRELDKEQARGEVTRPTGTRDKQLEIASLVRN